MTQQWQKDLPEAQGSVTVKTRNERELFRSETFSLRSGADYQVRVFAVWDDTCGNGSNAFYPHYDVVMAGTTFVSKRLGFDDDVPKRIKATIPPELLALKKWAGCHPFGPWYYIENTVSHAGDKDYNGLRVGEKNQLRRGGKEPVWHLVVIFPDGTEHPAYELNGIAYDGDEKPTSEYRVEWQPWWIHGRGKERELGYARNAAVWPDATDEQLMSDELPELLKARLPGLLKEFRAVIESLGVTW